MKTFALPHTISSSAMAIAILLLVACSPTTAPAANLPTQSSGPMPTTAPSPTAAAHPTAATSPTPVPSPTVAAIPIPAAPSATATLAPAPVIQTYTVKPDDQTQARLRFGDCIWNDQGRDIYINGQITQNGGVPYKLNANDFSGYLYLPPGKVNVAFISGGAGLDLNLEAGHRYTVVGIDPLDGTLHNALVIDETKVIKDAGATVNQYTAINVNNLLGPAGIDHVVNGKVSSSIPYGKFRAEVLPDLPWKSEVFSVTGAPDKIIHDYGPSTGTGGTGEGSVDSITCWSGKYPGVEDNDYTAGQSLESTAMGLLAYLQHYTDQNKVLNDPSNSFNTFLALVKEAGMTDALNTAPHLIFVPTDKAFNLYLPKDKLDALLADPKAAKAFLLEYMVEGFYPYGSLQGVPPANVLNAPFPGRTLTAMSGRSLVLSGQEPPRLNGDNIGNEFISINTANGSRFWPIAHLLQVP
jgi:hypothetical protein